MKKMNLSLFARTPVHVGAGNSVGAVDSPIQRERHTRIPIIPSSSLKGVIADLWNDENFNRTAEGKKLFGEDDSNAEAKSGSLMIGEARVLAFPVRSAKGMFAWITCPLALKRFARDTGAELEELPELKEHDCLSSPAVELDGCVVLEEYRTHSVGSSAAVAQRLESVCSDSVWGGMPERLVVLSDDLFTYFVEQACEVVSRIRIDDTTGVVAKGALFNQEQVPSETLFYTTVFADTSRFADTEEVFRAKMESGILQVGGNASTGLGYCSVEVF
jgi:CRISPR-associated protein Cmr4